MQLTRVEISRGLKLLPFKTPGSNIEGNERATANDPFIGVSADRGPALY
jgi:hypothetical protein